VIRSQAATQNIRITQHAQQEMVEEAILLDDVLHSLGHAQLLEDYPDHPRGACCLLNGVDQAGRNIHIVCTTAQERLIIITVYLPVPPKWVSPTQRRKTP
jgi:hypothetical protein